MSTRYVLGGGNNDDNNNNDDDDDDVHLQRVPSDDPQVAQSDRFVMSDRGPSYEYSLTFHSASRHHAGHYVCVVFSGGQFSVIEIEISKIECTEITVN